MFRRFVLSLALVATFGCDVEEEEVMGIEQPSQTDLEAIAEGPPSAANREDLDLLSAPRPQFAGWMRVCASSLTLRNAPGGNTLGTLYNGYWFYKNGTSGSWSSGYSNELGMWGWVLTPYLC